MGAGRAGRSPPWHPRDTLALASGVLPRGDPLLGGVLSSARRSWRGKEEVEVEHQEAGGRSGLGMEAAVGKEENDEDICAFCGPHGKGADRSRRRGELASCASALRTAPGLCAAPPHQLIFPFSLPPGLPSFLLF